jgi:ribokinase
MVVRVDLLPRPGQTVIGGQFTRAFGGKGANAAAAAAALGARTWMVGMVGDDDLGAAIRGDLAGRGVDTSFLRTCPAPTGVALILVDEPGENLIAVASGANAELSGDDVWNALADLDVKGAVVLSNLEVGEDPVEAAAESSERRDWRFVLNPAPARRVPTKVLALADVLTPNEHEIGELGPASPEELLEAGAGAVVVTRGAAGADLYRAGRALFHQDAFPVEVVDTTGAGDAFSATLAWALAEGHLMEESVRLAAAGGALATRAVGARASLADRIELERLAGT